MRFWRRKPKEIKKEEALPLEKALPMLIDLKAVTIKNHHYTYSPEFVESVEEVRSNPPGMLEQMRYGSKVAKDIIPLLITTAKSYQSRKDVENFLTAYICLDKHLKRLNLTVDKKYFTSLAFAIWYLNDHKPTVEEIKGVND